MKFNDHARYRGSHAFLGASNPSWINYDEEKLVATYYSRQATKRGNELHDLAATLIRLREKLPKTTRTLNMYVNDAIGYKMNPEQILFYSDNAYGTADAISFRNGRLRIHDLKTGVTPARMEQLEVYAAYFCLEYKIKPSDIEIDLRIYQNDTIIQHHATAEDIVPIIDKAIYYDRLIDKLKLEEG